MRLSQIFKESGVGTMVRRVINMIREDYVLVGKLPNNTYLLMDLDSSKLIEPMHDDWIGWEVIKPPIKRYLWAHQVKQTFECIIMHSSRYMTESEANIQYGKDSPKETKFWKLPFTEMEFPE